MRAKYAVEIRAGIDRARREVAKGIPPRPDVTMLELPEPLEERAYRRTWRRFRPTPPEPSLRLPRVPGPSAPISSTEEER